jgi:hypothetical protein
MDKLNDFQGFSEPKENYYRLPNNWFDYWISFRAEVGDRFAVPLKVLEYVLLHTWGASRFDGHVRLSANEIHSGRRRKKKIRWDSGVGVSENAVKKAAEVLAKIGALNVFQDQKDKARRMRTYQPNLKSEDLEPEEDLLAQGFKKPTENYFKIPKSWITVIREIGSAAVILTVEYLIRHSWGYHNEDGIWLTAEEIANGRKYSDESRYDNGTGFALATVQRALKKAGELGLVAWQEHFDSGIITRKYNLRFQGMKTDASGRLLEIANDAIEEVCDANEVVDDAIEAISQNTNEVVDDAVEDTNDAIEEVDDTNEERSLKDTPIDTIPRHEIKTPSSPRAKKVKKQTPPPRRKAIDGSGGDEKIILPDELLTMLEEMDWSDTTTIIKSHYAKDSQQVTSWAKYALQKSGLTNRAGYFRKRLLSGEKAPALPKLQEPSEDRNRYISGEFADYLD